MIGWWVGKVTMLEAQALFALWWWQILLVANRLERLCEVFDWTILVGRVGSCMFHSTAFTFGFAVKQHSLRWRGATAGHRSLILYMARFGLHV
jgi:hypothetical protein